MSRYSNIKARIEKKFSTTAKELLLSLSNFQEKDFFLDDDCCDGVWHQQWRVEFGPDYYGEYDSYDSFWLLYSALIDNTTDFEGISKAEEENDWREGTNLEPYYSPWRGANRAEIISHCRDLVKAGVTLERIR